MAWSLAVSWINNHPIKWQSLLADRSLTLNEFGPCRRFAPVAASWTAALLADCGVERQGIELFGRDSLLLGRLLTSWCAASALLPCFPTASPSLHPSDGKELTLKIDLVTDMHAHDEPLHYMLQGGGAWSTCARVGLKATHMQMCIGVSFGGSAAAREAVCSPAMLHRAAAYFGASCCQQSIMVQHAQSCSSARLCLRMVTTAG